MRGPMRTGAGLVLAGGLSLQCPALAQQCATPSVSTAYFDTALSFNTCMQRGESALQAYGAENVQRLNTAISGTYGDFTVMVVCITTKGLILVMVAGPDATTGANHLNSVVQKMQAR